MVPFIKLCLPPGKIGVTFTNANPPAIVDIDDDSLLKGKIEIGYEFDTLYLADGTEFSGCNLQELTKAFREHMDEQGRKLKLRMTLPSTSTVTVPPGDHGMCIEGNPPKITLIQRDSPLRGKLRVGMVVDSITLEDGTTYLGHAVEEIASILKDSRNTARTMVLKNEATMLSDRAVKLPESKEVTLPSGKIGSRFQGCPAMIAEMSVDSQMRSQFRVGMIADTLRLPDGCEYSGLEAVMLAKLLAVTTDIEGRVLVLKNPASENISKKTMTKLALPSGDLGIEFEGEAATISDVSEDSPLYNKVWSGQIIETIGLADGTEYGDLTGPDALDILMDSADSEGRWMLLRLTVASVPDAGIHHSGNNVRRHSRPSERREVRNLRDDLTQLDSPQASQRRYNFRRSSSAAPSDSLSANRPKRVLSCDTGHDQVRCSSAKKTRMNGGSNHSSGPSQDKNEATTGNEREQIRNDQIMRREEEQMLYGDRLSWDDPFPADTGPGKIHEQETRRVYFALDDETPLDISQKFDVPVGRILYDNIVMYQDLKEKSRLIPGTTIILPSSRTEKAHKSDK